MQRSIRFLGLAVVAAAAALPLPAQTISGPRPGQFGIALEAMRPQFKTPEGDFSLKGATVILGAHAELQPGLRAVIELPYAFSKSTVGVETQSDDSFGNPYLGVQLLTSRLTLNLGGRIPLASDDEGLIGFFGGLTDLERFDAYFPDLATISGSGRIEHVGASGLGLAFTGGASVWLPTDDENGNQTELVMLYAGELFYRSRTARAGVRASGMLAATESGSVGERTLNQLGVFVDFGSGAVRPVLQMRVPLDGVLREANEWSGGIGLQIILGDR